VVVAAAAAGGVPFDAVAARGARDKGQFRGDPRGKPDFLAIAVNMQFAGCIAGNAQRHPLTPDRTQYALVGRHRVRGYRQLEGAHRRLGRMRRQFRKPAGEQQRTQQTHDQPH
jgi:hypothetical protein